MISSILFLFLICVYLRPSADQVSSSPEFRGVRDATLRSAHEFPLRRRSEIAFIAGRSWAVRPPGSARWRWPRSSIPSVLKAGSPNPQRDRWPGVVHPLHFAPKAKRVIYLYMAGGPSHLETFDYKPELAEMHGQPMPESFTKGSRSPSSRAQKLDCFAPQHPFQTCGSSGQEISAIFPHLGHGRRRALHHPLDGDRGDQPRPGAHLHEHRHDASPAGRHGFLAELRPGQRERQPARLRRADLAGTVRPGAADLRRGNGTAGSCPAGSRASISTPRATRCSTWAGPRATTADRQRDVVDAVQQLNSSRTSGVDDPEIATRITPTRWPSGCRPASRN